MTTDPFGTAELRSAVLAAWERTPARFREDANTEEDHATGYYRDRVVVELAQNAADAATRAGVPGHVALWLVEDGSGARLVVANTGAWLDADGVASLASLRASAKSASASSATTVGRFGVGFAAVRGVSDEVTVASRSGGVRFSLRATTEALAPLGTLTDHVTARAGTVPVLRLPFPAPAHEPAPDQPPGLDLARYDTVITLELRDAVAVAAVRDQLAAIDDTLLLALPALESVRVVDGLTTRELRDVAARWFTVTRSGVVPEEMLADRPVEERARTGWTVTWAFPRDTESAGRVHTDLVVHAPTPTDEPLSLPAVLLATFPLDPSRRHVAAGALTGLLVQEAGAAYSELALVVPEPLDLVPTGLPRGRLDAELCDATEEALRRTPLIGGRLAQDTVVLEGEASQDLVTALEPTGLGVVHVDRRRRSAARRLGARPMTLADIIDALPDRLSPRQWHDLYDALAGVEITPAVREALTAILVPLADGGTARGPRGMVMGGAARAGRIDGVHRVHPDAAHPLLLQLGAVADDDPAVLTLAAVEQAAHRIGDELLEEEVRATHQDAVEDLAALYELVAAVVRTNRVDAQQAPDWLGDLPLPSDEGLWQRAAELSWPGSWADDHLDLPAVDLQAPGGVGRSLTPVTEDVAGVLGVRFGLVVREVAHETGGAGEDEDRPGWADYDDYLCAVLGEHQSVDRLSVVDDLDVVAEDSWGAVLGAVVADRELRRAVLEPVRAARAVDGQSGTRPVQALSYAAWYLRDLFGAPWAGWTAAGAPGTDELRSVLRPAPPELDDVTDPDLVRALGGVASLADLAHVLTTADPGTWYGFFDGLWQTATDEDPAGRAVPIRVAQVVWAALERSCQAGLELDPLPDLLIVLQGMGARIAPAEAVVVTDAPMWSQVRPVVPVVSAECVDLVASALDCAVADRSTVEVVGGLDPQVAATVHPIPTWLDVLVPGLPASWTEHPELSVDGRDVDWWVGPDSVVHVRSGAPASALARACAQVAGRWDQRHLVELALQDGGRRAELLADRAWDPPVIAEERSPVR